MHGSKVQTDNYAAQYDKRQVSENSPKHGPLTRKPVIPGEKAYRDPQDRTCNYRNARSLRTLTVPPVNILIKAENKDIEYGHGNGRHELTKTEIPCKILVRKVIQDAAQDGMNLRVLR